MGCGRTVCKSQDRNSTSIRYMVLTIYAQDIIGKNASKWKKIKSNQEKAVAVIKSLHTEEKGKTHNEFRHDMTGGSIQREFHPHRQKPSLRVLKNATWRDVTPHVTWRHTYISQLRCHTEWWRNEQIRLCHLPTDNTNIWQGVLCVRRRLARKSHYLQPFQMPWSSRHNHDMALFRSFYGRNLVCML
jgi:hypothetical protein